MDNTVMCAKELVELELTKRNRGLSLPTLPTLVAREDKDRMAAMAKVNFIVEDWSLLLGSSI